MSEARRGAGEAPRSPATRGLRGARAAALAAFVLLASPPRARAEEPRDDATLEWVVPAGAEIDVVRLLEPWARKFDATLEVDPDVAPLRVRFATVAPAWVCWGLVKLLLCFSDVVVVESQREPGGPWRMRAHSRSNLSAREPAPYWCLMRERAGSPPLWTAFVPTPAPGAGRSVFRAVRDLIVRDPHRMGNVFYLEWWGEHIMIVDVRSKLERWARIAASLGRASVRLHEVRHADAWDLARRLGRLFGSGQRPAPRPGAPEAVAPPVFWAVEDGVLAASASTDLHAEIAAVIAELDRPRRRVLIEETSWEVAVAEPDAAAVGPELASLAGARGGERTGPGPPYDPLRSCSHPPGPPRVPVPCGPRAPLGLLPLAPLAGLALLLLVPLQPRRARVLLALVLGGLLAASATVPTLFQ